MIKVIQLYLLLKPLLKACYLLRYFSIFSPYALSERIIILQNDNIHVLTKSIHTWWNIHILISEFVTVLKVWQQQRLAKSLIYPHIIICICSTSMQKEGILVRNSYSLIHSKASKLLKRRGAQLENLWWRCVAGVHMKCAERL